MQIDDFKAIISTFADPGTEILVEKQKILFSINGDVIDASISTRAGDVYVDQGGEAIPASSWILKRLANVPLLASRLREQIPDNPFYVSPAAIALESLTAKPDDELVPTNDALGATFNLLRDRSPLETTVLYVTSDAGEGKTALINQMAREQAARFLKNEVDWLLVPIPLGGRHFLRFDDITVGALQNRYRFPFLYYNSFLALVRMGVIVPAFDGFEEMFVENSSGEALSAMGLLVGALNSTGAVVIAARKAYFEFENLKAQEKLYDSISGYSVGFAKLELQRWGKSQFLGYCKNRKVTNAERIFERVSERLGNDHSLLTRPVLVKRLVDIASESATLESFLEKIHNSGADFFSVFVRGIIEREANEKWIDRSGDVGSPLLTVDEHCELLALIALSMWESRVDHLKRDHLEFVSDYFCETKRKTSMQSQQIRERVRGHALLIASPNTSSAVEFDHDEFRLFFLGEGVADQLEPLSERAKAEMLGTLRRGVLPEHSQLAFIRAVNRNAALDRLNAAQFLLDVSQLDGQASYTHENCSSLFIRLISGLDGRQIVVENLAFGTDVLRDSKLTNLVFLNCYFSPSSLEMTNIEGCIFRKCKFGQLRVYTSTTIVDSSFEDCTFDALRLADQSIDFWEPNAVKSQLERLGAIVGAQQSLINADPSNIPTFDEELHNIEKLLRYFMRSTHISESVILIKLGDKAQGFLDHTVPYLLDAGVLQEIDNRGGGVQHRYKLGMQLEKLNSALSAAQGSYAAFIKHCADKQ